MVLADAGASMVRLARRWVVDYFNSHDASAAREFITPDYALEIGEYRFVGRDDQWLPAVQKQMDLFPGLGMTVHQVVASRTRVAVLFTQHGASGGGGGPVACWSGVAIYRGDGHKLSGCVAQEDYFTRQRQLKSGVADAIDAPVGAPWDTPALPADPQAEGVVRAWLGQSWPCQHTGVRCDDENVTGSALQFEVQSGAITELFSSGAEVAFHVRQSGRYLGGLAGIPARSYPVILHCNGIVRVQGGAVRSGRVIRDRAGLRASLAREAGA